MPAPDFDELEPLPAEVRAYVDAFAEDERPARNRRAAGWVAIEAELARDRRRRTMVMTGTLVAAAAAVLLVVGALRGAVLRSGPAAPSVQVPWDADVTPSGGALEHEPPTDREGALPAASDGLGSAPGEASGSGLTASGPAVAPPSSSSPSPRRRRPTVATGADPAPPAPSTSALAEELALVRTATLAQRSGDSERALARLDEHRERFPRGALEREATVLRAEASCSLGRVDAAVRLRERFLAQHPASPLASRMRSVCR